MWLSLAGQITLIWSFTGLLRSALDGSMGSPHCIEIPFVFDNVLLHRTFTGGAEDAVELGHRVSTAWTSFANTGRPSAKGLPEWEPYPAQMTLNIESTINTIN